MQPNKHVYMSCESSFDEATTVIYGAPFDGTVQTALAHALQPMQFVQNHTALKHTART